MTQVRGDQIRDGTITDADVAANAAISASKLDASLATQTYVNNALSSAGVSVPSGTIMPYAGTSSTPPSGWAWCDGATRTDGATTAAGLFAAIGTYYGGTGASSFVLPDLRGRVIAGLDSLVGGSYANRITLATAGFSAQTMNSSGGVQAVTLTGPQSGIQAHKHANAGGGTYYQNASGIYSVPGGGTAGFAEMLNAGPTNAQEAHTNVQPTIILRYMIKL